MPIKFKKFPYYNSSDHGVSFVTLCRDIDNIGARSNALYSKKHKDRLFVSNRAFLSIDLQYQCLSVKYTKHQRFWYSNIIKTIKTYITLYKEYEKKFVSVFYKSKRRIMLEHLENLVNNDDKLGIIEYIVENIKDNNNTIRPHLMQDMFLSISTVYYQVHACISNDKQSQFDPEIIKHIEYLIEKKFCLSSSQTKLYWKKDSPRPQPKPIPKSKFIAKVHFDSTIYCDCCNNLLLKYSAWYNKYKVGNKESLTTLGYRKDGYKGSNYLPISPKADLRFIFGENLEHIYICDQCYAKGQLYKSTNNYHTHNNYDIHKHKHKHINNHYYGNMY